MYQFFAELPLVRLTPCQANLTSLKLHVDVQWGYLPKADLRGMHFPKLQKLDLGSYTFSHDWQLEWIAAHGATLQELTPDNCLIVQRMRDYGQLDSEGYAVDRASDMGPERT